MKPITDVHALFRYQRAIRNFTAEEVPDELVDRVLTAAIHGPSGSNTQPWHFIVIRDQAVKQAISDVYEEARADAEPGQATGCRRGASAALGRTGADRRLRQHASLRPGRIPDRCLDLPECAESHAGSARPRARYRAHHPAPPSQGSYPCDPRHPRSCRERRHHPTRLARPRVWPEPAAAAGAVCDARPLDRLGTASTTQQKSLSDRPSSTPIGHRTASGLAG